MAAGLAEPGDLGQDPHRFLPVGPRFGFDPLQGLEPQGLVKGGFFLAQLHLQHHLGARRQFLQHLGFDAAEDEGLDQLFQPPSGLAVVEPLDGQGEAGVESLTRSQQAGIDEIEQGPQFAQVVFDRACRW